MRLELIPLRAAAIALAIALMLMLAAIMFLRTKQTPEERRVEFTVNQLLKICQSTVSETALGSMSASLRKRLRAFGGDINVEAGTTVANGVVDDLPPDQRRLEKDSIRACIVPNFDTVFVAAGGRVVRPPRTAPIPDANPSQPSVNKPSRAEQAAGKIARPVKSVEDAAKVDRPEPVTEVVRVGDIRTGDHSPVAVAGQNGSIAQTVRQ